MRVLREHALFGAVCFLVGIATIVTILFAYLYFGNAPVAVADPPLPLERWLAHTVLERRLDRQVQTSPIQASQASFEGAAHVYVSHCAVCHGVPGNKAEVGAEMFPRAPQLWASHRAGVVGVSDDPVGETFWKVQNGIRLSGMPSFKQTLSTNDMWQVSLLLSQANQTMPTSVLAALETGSEGK